jgi:alcohol dehydrogenase
MKALVFDGRLELREIPKPGPPPGESLVRVVLAGICKTDLEITRGYMDFRGVLGHEFVGVVETSGDPRLVGKRVVGEINAGCGKCPLCAQGLDRHCSRRTVLGILGRDGAMAEYAAIPDRNLIEVPAGVSDEKAVFTEPLAAALEIMEQVKIEPSHRGLVIGDGRLGLLAAMVLRLTGCDLTLAGKHKDKLDLFAGMGGTTLLVDELTPGADRFDFVVEASGSPSGWGLAVGSVRPRGTIILKSTYHGGFEFNPAALVIDEITLIGSRCGRLAPALRVMELGLVDPTPLISAVYPLEEAERAFQRAFDRKALKVLLKV